MGALKKYCMFLKFSKEFLFENVKIVESIHHIHHIYSNFYLKYKLTSYLKFFEWIFISKCIKVLNTFSIFIPIWFLKFISTFNFNLSI